ncbi:MAG: hypothetical protein K2N34_13590 [Lachnospiraceae bacterium]|nr:hypothetical protein [Lachnospiraceae bacterium]
MYHYIQNKDFMKRMKRLCSGIINQLVQSINNDSVMTVRAYLVGSGAQNLVTQNGNEPIDLDYNICIIDRKSANIYTEREIKEYIRKKFNKILNANGWSDCRDSTSVLTTEKRQFTRGIRTAFSIDLAIIEERNNGWYRLIHVKTGLIIFDRYYWNEVPSSKGLQQKVNALKSNNLWNNVREVYLDKKNMYLCRNDYSHPSFIVYIETVNQIYNEYFYSHRDF